jgi:putative transcriptional regulator
MKLVGTGFVGAAVLPESGMTFVTMSQEVRLASPWAHGPMSCEEDGPMGLSHHPSAELRADYHVGNVSPGAAIAVAVHLSLCEQCALLVQEEPRSAEAPWIPSWSTPGADLARSLPPMLAAVPRGRWRRVGRGAAAAPLQEVSGLAESVHLVRLRPGAALPFGVSAELLVLLGGGIIAPLGDMHPGDLLELGPLGGREIRGHPEAGALALVVGDDTLYRGLLGRLLP